MLEFATLVKSQLLFQLVIENMFLDRFWGTILDKTKFGNYLRYTTLTPAPDTFFFRIDINVYTKQIFTEENLTVKFFRFCTICDIC